MAVRFVESRVGDTVVRQAKPEDRQSVIDVDDNVYDGLDYIPTMYHQFLQSRQQLMLVLEDAGNVVRRYNRRH